MLTFSDFPKRQGILWLPKAPLKVIAQVRALDHAEHPEGSREAGGLHQARAAASAGAAVHNGQAAPWRPGLHLGEVALVGATLLDVLDQGRVLVEVERLRRSDEEAHGSAPGSLHAVA
jgi:hypothetical protein